ncbi:hypothetical protein D3C86_971830 [compost metagenome]
MDKQAIGLIYIIGFHLFKKLQVFPLFGITHLLIALYGRESAVFGPYTHIYLSPQPLFTFYIMVAFDKDAPLQFARRHQEADDLCRFTPAIYIIAQEDECIAGRNRSPVHDLLQAPEPPMYIAYDECSAHKYYLFINTPECCFERCYKSRVSGIYRKYNTLKYILIFSSK